ncbi:MAG: hypothetical protein KC502_17705, partial [Myxococcales bacterium]|nr:hypothetical protein [Myxococcales bacterium]
MSSSHSVRTVSVIVLLVCSVPLGLSTGCSDPKDDGAKTTTAADTGATAFDAGAKVDTAANDKDGDNADTATAKTDGGETQLDTATTAADTQSGDAGGTSSGDATAADTSAGATSDATSADGQGGDAAGAGDGGGIPEPQSGCADGTREGFLDMKKYSKLAACSGAWSVPGI